MEMRRSADHTLHNERMFSARGSQVWMLLPGVFMQVTHFSDRIRNEAISFVFDMSTSALILTRFAVKTAIVAMMIPRQFSLSTILTAFHWIFTP